MGLTASTPTVCQVAVGLTAPTQTAYQVAADWPYLLARRGVAVCRSRWEWPCLVARQGGAVCGSRWGWPCFLARPVWLPGVGGTPGDRPACLHRRPGEVPVFRVGPHLHDNLTALGSCRTGGLHPLPATGTDHVDPSHPCPTPPRPALACKIMLDPGSSGLSMKTRPLDPGSSAIMNLRSVAGVGYLSIGRPAGPHHTHPARRRCWPARWPSAPSRVAGVRPSSSVDLQAVGGGTPGDGASG